MILAQITIDETADGQTIYVPELDKGTNGLFTFIEIYTLKQTDIKNQLSKAQTDVATAQMVLDKLTAQINEVP